MPAGDVIVIGSLARVWQRVHAAVGRREIRKTIIVKSDRMLG